MWSRWIYRSLKTYILICESLQVVWGNQVKVRQSSDVLIEDQILLIKISLHCTDCHCKICYLTKICRNLPVFYRQMLSSCYKLSYYFWEVFTRKRKIVLFLWEKVFFLNFLANRNKHYRKSYFRSKGENNFVIINLSIQIFSTSLFIILEERGEYNSPSSHWENFW